MKNDSKLLRALKTLCVCCVMALSLSLQAAYLTNVPVVLTQPDGTSLHCYATGDEFYVYLHDASGYTIVADPITGYYVYADLVDGILVPTAFVAGVTDPSTTSLRPRLNISAEQWQQRRNAMEQHIRPVERRGDRELNKGEYNNLIIYIRFQGDAELNTTKTEIDSMFNNTNHNAVSMYNYFKHASYNQLFIQSYSVPEPTGEQLISYEDIHPRAYYQPYNQVSNPIGYQEHERAEREFDLLERACNFVADAVPTNVNWDYNDDGNIDNVVFVVKGNVGGWSDLLWPHRWVLYDRDVMICGKVVRDFNFQLETSTYFSTSTLCHEMFHSLGAPDLYHYSYEGLSPVGAWDLMCNNTNPPQHSGAYMKHRYGNWIDELPVITDYGTYTLDAIAWEGNRNNVYKILTNDPNQFYLLEYRNKESFFERGVPGSGLLIYRIDTRFSGCASYNGYDQFDEVYIFRPGGSQTNDGAIAAAHFSANINHTTFNKDTDPYPFFTGGSVDESFNICNISETGNTMSFTYCPLQTGPLPHSLSANMISDDAVRLSWLCDGNSSYNVYRDGVKVADNVLNKEYVDNNVLQGYHSYYVTATHSGNESFRSNETSVIVGDFCNLRFVLNSSHGNGWMGAALSVSFVDTSMPSRQLTLYSGSSDTVVLSVPKSVGVSLSWLGGWDDAACSFSLTYEDGTEIFTPQSTPQPGVLVEFINNCDSNPCIAPQDLVAYQVGSEVHLEWTSFVFSESYNIYRDGELIGSSDNTSFVDDELSGSGTKMYHVTAMCGDTESMPSNEAMVSVMGYMCDSPQNLTAVNQDVDNVYLEWQKPQGMLGGLYYDNGQYLESTGSSNMTWAICITPESLVNFADTELVKLAIFDAAEGEYKFKIHSGEKPSTSNMLHSQEQNMTASMQIVDVVLTESVSFDVDKPLWVTVQAPGVSVPGACCAYTGDPNSALIKAGATWNPLPMYDMNLSWILRAYVAKPAEGFTYNLYRNNNHLVASDLEALNYLDRNLYVGNHCYWVTASINGVESEQRSNVACAAVTVLSVDEQNNIRRMYPNPTQDKVFVEGNGITEVVVYDILGQELLRLNGAGEDLMNIDLSSFNNGVYLLKVSDADGSETKRVSIAR